MCAFREDRRDNLSSNSLESFDITALPLQVRDDKDEYADIELFYNGNKVDLHFEQQYYWSRSGPENQCNLQYVKIKVKENRKNIITGSISIHPKPENMYLVLTVIEREEPISLDEETADPFRGIGREIYKKMIEYISALPLKYHAKFIHRVSMDLELGERHGRPLDKESWERIFLPLLVEYELVSDKSGKQYYVKQYGLSE